MPARKPTRPRRSSAKPARKPATRPAKQAKRPAKKPAAPHKPATRPAKQAKRPAKKPAAPQVSHAARVLHRRALRANWDDGIWRFQRIIDDPACDYGTALLIYWRGAPGFDQQYKTAKEVESWRKLTYRFLRQLEKRLLRKQFATSNILFNPRFDRTTLSSKGHDWTAEYDDIPKHRPIPEALKEPSCLDPAWEARGRAPIKNTANRLT